MIRKYLAFIFFLFWAIWLSGEFILGPFSHVRIHDNGDSLLPQLIASKIQFFKYGFSYFADYMASGVDATSQSLLPFSNLNSLLFLIMPGWMAYGLMMFLQRFLASYFTYRLSRDSLKLAILPSVIAGVLFSLFNFSIFSFTLYHQLGLPGLPLIIWALDRIFESKKSKKYIYLILLGLFVGYSNYFAYFTPYLIPFIFVWFLFIKRDLWKKIILNLIIFLSCVLLIQFHSIYAVILNSQFSHRLAWIYPQYREFLPAVTRLINAVFWQSFISIGIIFISVLKLRMKVEDNLRRLLFTSFSVFLISLTYKLFQPFFPKFLGILSSFSVDRILFVLPFLLAISAGVSLNSLLKSNKSLVTTKVVVTILVAVLIGTSIKIKMDTVKNYAPYRNLYEHPDLVELTKEVDLSQWRLVTMTGGGFRSSYPLANGFSTVDTYLTLYPESYHQFWTKVIAKRIETDKLKYEDFVYWGNRIYLYGPQEFYDLDSIEFRKYYDLDLLSLANVKYIISMKPLADPSLFLLPSSYMERISKWEDFSRLQKLPFFLKGKYFGPSLYIYENKKVLPRFFALENGEVSSQPIQVVYYSPDKIILTANNTKPSQIVATLNYYPWWKVTVNGQHAAVSKYQSAFISVEVPKGSNTVILEYKPPYKLPRAKSPRLGPQSSSYSARTAWHCIHKLAECSSTYAFTPRKYVFAFAHSSPPKIAI